MIDPELLKILCCPETHQPLRLAEPPEVDSVNKRIASGKVKNRGGKEVNAPCDGGLIRSDGQFFYPIRNNIPLLLIGEALALT